MIRLIKKQLFKDDKLLFHTIFFMAASLLGSFFNYVFHLYLGRSLGPEQYGEFGSLFSIASLIFTGSTAFLVVYSRFVSEHKAKGELGRVNYLFKKSLKHMLGVGLLVFIFIVIIRYWFSDFLHLTATGPLIILGIYIGLNFLSPVFMGIVNGLQRFKWQSIMGAGSPLLKLIMAILFVSFGFGLNGAMWSLLFQMIPYLLLGYIAISSVLKEKPKKVNVIRFYKSIIPVYLAQITPLMMITIDIIIVKHFFSSTEAGYYVAASTIAKIVWYVSSSASQVLLPKIANANALKKRTSALLMRTIFITFCVSLPVLMVYMVFPGFVVNLLYGAQYDISNLIGFFGLGFLFYVLMNVLVMYNLAIKRNNFVYFLMILLLSEVSLIYLFHSSLIQVIRIVVGTCFLSFMVMLFYTRRFNSEKVVCVGSCL